MRFSIQTIVAVEFGHYISFEAYFDGPGILAIGILSNPFSL
jgi:hypothetical protein